MTSWRFVLVLLLGVIASAAQAQGGDPTAGEQVFRKCQACHSLEAGRRTVGPHLQGVIGRSAGTVEGYNYSVAMKRSGLVWSADVLDKFLASPSHFLHGTKMIFTGLRRPEDRANVIAYLQQTSGASQPAAQAPAPAPAEQAQSGTAAEPTPAPAAPAAAAPA